MLDSRRAFSSSDELASRSLSKGNHGGKQSSSCSQYSKVIKIIMTYMKTMTNPIQSFSPVIWVSIWETDRYCIGNNALQMYQRGQLHIYNLPRRWHLNCSKLLPCDLIDDASASNRIVSSYPDKVESQTKLTSQQRGSSVDVWGTCEEPWAACMINHTTAMASIDWLSYLAESNQHHSNTKCFH